MLNRRSLFEALRRGLRVRLNGQRASLGRCGANGITPLGLDIDYIRIPRPCLVDFSDDKLVFYKAGYREMTEAEQALYERWRHCGNTSITQKFAYFRTNHMPYLVGYGKFGGKMLDLKRLADGEAKCIMDDSIRGDIEYEFEVGWR